jgi:Tfp pilus assembly protein PilO
MKAAATQPVRSVLVLIVAFVAAISFVGCAKEGVTEDDAKRMKEEFSQENYEKAMKAAGKEKELEEQKAREAARTDSQYEGQQ